MAVDDSIELLQESYDRLTALRARAIRAYDAAPDGSQQKRDALAQMDELGDRIRKVERRIELVLDADEAA